MKQNTWSSLVTFAMIVAVSLCAFGGKPAMAADTIDEDDYNLVRLLFKVDFTGRPFISVNPMRAKLWRDTPDRPWMIRWTAADNGLYGDLYWEIRYDSGSDAASHDYFGDIDIDCGERAMDVVAKMKPEESNAKWPFKVTVFSCADGVKGPARATLHANPRIIWKD